jgi:hypothetical protein
MSDYFQGITKTFPIIEINDTTRLVAIEAAEEERNARVAAEARIAELEASNAAANATCGRFVGKTIPEPSPMSPPSTIGVGPAEYDTTDEAGLLVDDVANAIDDLARRVAALETLLIASVASPTVSTAARSVP